MFFIATWLLCFVPAVIHIFVDRNPQRRTKGRVLELLFFWQLGGYGALALFGGFGHIGPNHEEIADQIGFAHSPFQWEVGFADLAVGVLLLLAVWKRGDFIIPAILAFAIMYFGDAIGHINEWVQNDNTEPYNTYAIPSDIGQPVLLIIFYFLVRSARPEALARRAHRRRSAGRTAQAGG